MNTQLITEYEYYLTHLDEMVSKHLNQFVLIKNKEIIDFFPTYEDALRSGLSRLGDVPFLVKIVQAKEEVIYFHQRVSQA